MIEMSKKMKWICGIGAFILVVALLSMCGGSDEKSSSSAEEHQNESREMPASTMKLKGKHASLFKVEEPYVLSLVKTPENGWQVRGKITLKKVMDFNDMQFQPYLKSCHADFIDGYDVELASADHRSADFNTLLAKEVGESEEVIIHTWDYKRMAYDEAKKIYDATQSVVLTDIELEAVKKEDAIKKAANSVLEDDDVKELKDAAETAGKLLEAEKNLLDALF